MMMMAPRSHSCGRGIVVIGVALLLLALVGGGMVVAADGGDEVATRDADGFELIDSASFDDTLSLGNWLVVYCTNECQPVKAMLAAIKPKGFSFELGVVSCANDPRICEDQKITSDPTVKLHVELTNEVQVFSGELSRPALASWARRILRGNVVTLTSQSFPNTVGKGTWIIAFRNSYCMHSRTLGPVWRQLSVSGGRFGLRVGTVDCTASNDLCHKFKVERTPTVILFKNGSERKRFNKSREFNTFLDEWSVENLLTFATGLSPHEQLLARSKSRLRTDVARKLQELQEDQL